MLTPLLPVSHRQQQEQADCLAACSAMILEYLQIPFHYARLQRLLNVRSFGAFFSDVENLKTLGVAIVVAEGNIDTILQFLDSGLPVIVAVNTKYLPSYWHEAVGHAVLVIGVDEESVYLNDPAFINAPQKVDLNEFLSAWIERDYLYAVIKLE